MTTLRRFAADDHGATAVEYAGLAAMVVTLLLVALQTIGVNVSSKLNVISNVLR